MHQFPWWLDLLLRLLDIAIAVLVIWLEVRRDRRERDEQANNME